MCVCVCVCVRMYVCVCVCVCVCAAYIEIVEARMDVTFHERSTVIILDETYPPAISAHSQR